MTDQFRRIEQRATVVTAVIVITWLLAAPLLPAAAFLMVGMLAGLALWGGTFVALYFAYRDRASAYFPDERAIAERDLHAGFYRLAGKGGIAATTVLVWASQWHAAGRWLAAHPWLPYGLAIAGICCIAVNEFLEIPWRRTYRRTFSRPPEEEP